MWLLPVTMSTGWAAAAPYLSGRPSGANSKSESTLIWPRLLSNCCYCPGSQCSWDFCVLPLRVKSISHSLSGLLKLSPACLQSHVLWYLVFLLQDPQARGPDVGPRTLTPVGELLQYSYSPVCGLLSWGVWDLIISRVCLSYRLVASSLSLDVKYLFGRFQSFSLMIVQQWVVILVCSWEGVNSRSFYCAILSPIL